MLLYDRQHGNTVNGYEDLFKPILTTWGDTAMRGLKLLIAVSLIILLAFPCFAEVPKVIEYTGELCRSCGKDYPRGTYDIDFIICTDENCDEPIWEETHTVDISPGKKKCSKSKGKDKDDDEDDDEYECKKEKGAFTVLLGSINSLDDLPFDQPYYLHISEDTFGYYKIEPLVSVPYSIRSEFSNLADAAEDADTLDGKHYFDIADKMDEEIADHASIPDAHHKKTTSFAELTQDVATDAQIPDDITINYAASAGDADTLDGKDASDFLDISAGSTQIQNISGGLNIEGKVGIGTTTPSEKLEVDGDLKVKNIKLSNSDISDPESLRLIIDMDNDQVDQTFSVWNDGEAGTELFTIYETGYVTIGTTFLPLARLSVETENHYDAVEGVSHFRLGKGIVGRGMHDGDDAHNYGGYFVCDGGRGIGVRGWAGHDGDDSINYGGYFVCEGGKGIAVSGSARHDGDDSINYGGYFESRGDKGIGVRGWASNSGDDSINYGGYFYSYGGKGIGVYGAASNSSNVANRGGYFKARGTCGIGVEAEATGAGCDSMGEPPCQGCEGPSIGVYGHTSNPDGIGIGGKFISIGGFGTGVSGEGSKLGGHFRADSGTYLKGVYGVASNCIGSENYGGFFEVSNGEGIGVQGIVDKGTGVQGIVDEGTGVQGTVNEWGGKAVCGIASFDGLSYNWGGHFTAKAQNGIGVEGYGKRYDFYASGPGTNYGSFTGAHDVRLSERCPSEINPGMILSVTGKTDIRTKEDGSISLSSTLPKVKLSDFPEDKAILGVFVSEAPLPPGHWYQVKENERFGVVNALGEGRVWVSNINGNIEAEDYITSSVIPGYGQKQNDDVLHSYTLGKAIETVDWDSVTENIELNGHIYKTYLIAVVYKSG